jgi:SAM-dependent methyltransferase
VKLDDPAHVAAQYRTPANFDARVRIYELFDVSREPLQRWLFERLGLRGGLRVLELGCGTGNLWRDNAERIPATLSLTLSDKSAGMLATARERLRELRLAPEFREADIQSLPFPDASFDLAVASHMLYHVPDRARALSEVSRVLAVGGRFFAATYPWTHLLELRELVARFGLESLMLPVGRAPGEFDLERAVDELAEVFRIERVERRDSELRVTDADVLVAYVASLATAVEPSKLARLRAHVARQIELTGALRIQISAGVIAAAK